MTQTRANVSRFTFKVDQIDFLVVDFNASEKMSSPFSVDLALAAEENVVTDDILGKKGVLRVVGHRNDQQDRFFHGIVSEFRHAQIRGRFYLFHARLVPALWLLSLRQDCRIFQNKSVPEIVKQVLADARIPEDRIFFRLQNKYAAREYCVQYRETDLAFVSRLLEDEGIFYFFGHTEDRHVLVFGDDAGICRAILGGDEIEFHPQSGLDADNSYIHGFDLVQQLHSGKIVLKDYNYLKPSLDLTCEKEALESPFGEIFDCPGNYDDKDSGSNRAQVRLQEALAFKERAEGKSNCVHLCAGHTFRLIGHDWEELDKAYTLVEVRHFGRQPQVLGEQSAGAEALSYGNELLAIPKEVTFRPARNTPKARIDGIQTAMVVGPKDREAYTDEYGRVKVRFHWDHARESNGSRIADEQRTCWIRVVQSMAGPGWGCLFLPRPGHEVIVAFLEGDPDRPVVTGQVYHETHRPPYKLPDEKTKSTIKTSSSPDGNGFNEIRLDDKKDEEQIFIHAQKNLDLRVRNDRFETIGRNRHLRVEQDKIEHVENKRHEIVGMDHIEELGRDRHLNVKGKEAKQVAQSKSLTVNGEVIEVFKANHSEQTSGDYYLKGRNIVIEGMQNITLSVGGSYIAIEPGSIEIQTGGQIKIDGVKVEATSSGITEIKGGLVKIN